MRSLRKSATSGRLRLFFLGGNLTDRSFTSLLLLSSETILTAELRVSVSKEPHSGRAPPQLFNKSEAEKHHKTNDCSFLSSFMGMLTMSHYSHSIAFFCLPLFFVSSVAIV